ncbi:MAG: DNA-3-methyladenine glycosylase 2 family protein [Oscillospiraceae bacterium]|nr:DNA-3-methyladenine glycosylase 2 family protein [Oscillospiraceae bacterium]
MEIFELGNRIAIENLENFDFSDIFGCGQCFRFNQTGEGEFEGVAYGKYLSVSQKGNKIFLDASPEDFFGIWRDYFDVGRDYKKIFETLRRDETLKRASDFCPGIRILKQEPFECLISFIISQNNNIPRIKKIIESLCENFGDKIDCGKKACFSFPKAEKIAGLDLRELDAIRSGFRAKYILDAAKKVASGEIDLDSIWKMGVGEGAGYLKRIKGVGDKVSACALLFAYNKLEAFPVDVWIKKVLAKYYGDMDYMGIFGEYAGIANAYLFYYEREKGAGGS